jgi:heme exporter protein B
MISRALIIAQKDLKIEFRTREIITPLLMISFLILLALKLTFMYYDIDIEAFNSPLTVETMTSLILWITFCSSGMTVLFSSFAKEQNRGTLKGLMLCPVDRAAIYYGKVISYFILIMIINIVSVILFSLFFSYDYNGQAVSLIVVLILGTFSFVVVGTLVSGLNINVRAKRMFLPLLLTPLILFTTIIPSIIATSKALDGKILEAIPEFRIMGMFSVIYIACAYLFFEKVLYED